MNSHTRVENGRTLYPHMFGDQGWYDYRPEPYRHGVMEIYYWSMKDADRQRVPRLRLARLPGGQEPWLSRDRAPRRIRDASGARSRPCGTTTTTPDTRLADDPMAYNPATVGNLVRLMLGGTPTQAPGRSVAGPGALLRPGRRRPGLPEDVAALVDSLEDGSTSLVLVNLNQTESRTLIVQGGGYGEHLCKEVSVDQMTVPVHSTRFLARLAPGAGGRLKIRMKRYAGTPTLAEPWNPPW